MIGKAAIGERVKIMRLRSGLNQTDFATKMRVSRATIANYESAPASAKPSYEFLSAVLEQGWSVDWILSGEGSPLLGVPLLENKYSYISSVTAAALAKSLKEREKQLKWSAWGSVMKMLFQYAVLLYSEGSICIEEQPDYTDLLDSDLGHELQNYIANMFDVCNTADIFES